MKNIISHFLFFIYFLFIEIAPLITYLENILILLLRNDKINFYWLWGKICIKYTGCKLFLIENSSPIFLNKNKKCVYMLNHRDVYDFPIDAYLTAGSGLFISRYINIAVFPLQYIHTVISPTVFYFKRNQVGNKELFNENLYKKLMTSNCININIYPEGTRRMTNDIVPIKKGSSHLAWKYKMCIQIIITRNKEQVMNLKKITGNYGTKLYCFRSEPIDPENYNSFDEFNDYVTMIWEKSWNNVYGKEEKDLTAVHFNTEPYVYPLKLYDYFINNIMNLCIIITILYYYVI